jgi:hypothetical protein
MSLDEQSSAPWDYERQLIDRIAIREAAATLTPRLRRVMAQYYHRGETLEEIGYREGCGKERIRQILEKAERKLREAVAGPNITTVPPLQTTAQTFPPGFDKAAFLAHMRGLRDWEANRKAREFEVERRRLAEMLEEERRSRGMAAKLAETHAELLKAKGTSLPPGTSLKIKLPVQYTVHPGTIPPPPSHAPTKYHYHDGATAYPGQTYHHPPPLTHEEMVTKADWALRLFLLSRRPTTAGVPWLGKMATRVQYPRDGGQIGEAVAQLARDIPQNALLSAHPFELPEGVKGAIATNSWASLRVLASKDDLLLFVDATWDEGP